MMAKIGIIAGIIILSFAIFAIYKETQKKRQIQAAINELQEEADRIDKENKRMRENLQFLSSTDYLEIEAKDKLNQKNPDEEVVVLKTNVVQEEPEAEEVAPPKHEEKIEIANRSKWWNYFFKY